jgi:hypothetical protein
MNFENKEYSKFFSSDQKVGKTALMESTAETPAS